MNPEILERLKNSKNLEDHGLYLEYKFKEFITTDINKFWSKRILRRKFKEYCNGGNAFIFGYTSLNVGEWFWRRYKEYLKDKL